MIKVSSSHFCGFVVGAIAIASVASLTTMDNFASAQTARTIRVVVPYAPGGVTDAMMRMFAEQIGRTQGRSAVVENHPGAGTVIATEAVSHAAPDGNTILLVSNSFVINAHIRKLSYNPLSFEPICYLVDSPTIYAVNAASGYGTLNDLLVAARAKPGEFSMAGSGPATAFDIGFEMLKRAANIDMAFVPYGGTVPAVGALLGGHVTAAIGDYGVMAEYLRSRKLRALAAGSAARIEPLPDVPTVAESGFAGYVVGAWYGLVAPAKTPNETVSQLAEWFGAVMQSSEFRAKIVRLGLYPVGCDKDFRAHIRQQYDDYGRVIARITSNERLVCNGQIRPFASVETHASFTSPAHIPHSRLSMNGQRRLRGDGILRFGSIRLPMHHPTKRSWPCSHYWPRGM